MLIRLENVWCNYREDPVLQGINLQVEKGDCLGVIGPNGSGKTTLLRTISRVLPPRQGLVLLEEQDVYGMTALQAARKMAVLSQENSPDFPFTVEEAVMMGRIPFMKRWSSESDLDRAAVNKALERTATSSLAKRQFSELSGGERKRVLIARALAQEPQVLLLDEPTANLDLRYQLEVMELLAELRRESGLTVIMVQHDINLAARFSTQLLVLKGGGIFAAGTPREVVTPEMVWDVYRCRVEVEYRGGAGCPCIFYAV